MIPLVSFEHGFWTAGPMTACLFDDAESDAEDDEGDEEALQ